MEKHIQELLQKIKANKKYKSLADEIILKEIKNYLKSYPKANDITIIKQVRARLHRLYSSYQTKKKKKRDDYLEELKIALKNNKSIKEITNKLLLSTLSTTERLSDYQYIYSEIFKITGEPNSIADLGAGLSPCSFPFMNLKKIKYYAYDIDKDDINFLNKYFKIMKKEIKGKAAIFDLRDLSKISSLPSTDIVFLFKVIDLIDDKIKISERLIKNLFNQDKCKFIVASFATKTLTRKSMNFPKRKGFEKMLTRNNLKFKSFKTPNEIFYVISQI